MKDLVSVIVPVYNAENYLGDCLDSVLKQTYRNLDIILVDDGSTDSSGAICDKYARHDTRVRVIHKENGGNGDARNTGLKYARGEWIVWVDSDDVIHERQVEILLTVAGEKAADIVVGWYRAVKDDESVKTDDFVGDFKQKAEVLSEKHLYDDEFIKKRSMILTGPVSKIYRKKVYEGVQYPVGRKPHADTWTTWKTYERAKRVVFVDEVLYFWRENPVSLSRVFNLNHLTGIDAYTEQLEYFHGAGKQRYVEIVFASYTEMFFWCYNRMCENHMVLSELKPYMSYMRTHVKWLKLTKSLGLYMWIKYRYLAWYKIPWILRCNSNC